MDVPGSQSADSGVIFDIQRFSIHDGPGIRTTVFLKGCPLRCLWCSNPESQDFSPTLMVRDINCRACGACVEACPEGAIRLSREKGRKIDWDRCTQCLKCTDVCVYNALKRCGERVTVGEVLGEVLRDKDFYRNSGGGVTVSGGEALSQGDFVARLLGEAKVAGLHTVLDTSGYAPWAAVEKVLPFADLILWDIKHLDPKAHTRGTGVDNTLILDNLRRASHQAKGFWLRVPLIADYNDSESHVKEVIALGKALGAEKISLLPYHQGGESKCGQMGKVYPFAEGRSPTDQVIERLRGLIEAAGLQAGVGS
jgi:pyruvate formate lyase activating enzyme